MFHVENKAAADHPAVSWPAYGAELRALCIASGTLSPIQGLLPME